MATDSLSKQSNYIIRIQTNDADYPVYHGYMILFGMTELSKIFIPDFFYGISLKTKYPERFENLNLPSSSNKSQVWLGDVDKHFDDARYAVTSAILFLNIWGRENPSEQFIELMSTNYETYVSFFDTIFDHIDKKEIDPQLKRIARTLKYELDEIKQYMGPYQGNFINFIHRCTEVMAGILSMFCLHTVMHETFHRF